MQKAVGKGCFFVFIYVYRLIEVWAGGTTGPDYFAFVPPVFFPAVHTTSAISELMGKGTSP